MSTKISIREIVSNHWGTLIDSNTGRTSKMDILTFYILPFFIAIVFLVIMPTKISSSKDIINIIITIFSIFIGLFMNLTVLLIDLYNKNNSKLLDLIKSRVEDNADLKEDPNEEIEKSQIVNQVLKQTMYSIFYSIFISVLTIVVCLSSYVNLVYFKSKITHLSIEPLQKVVVFLSDYDPIVLIEQAMHFIIYYLAIHFLLILIMIVKRFSKLVNYQMS